tara:strand:- start:97 stop:444 length:348 start_codon:yes stop_codon:yes gene_type:complete
MQKIEDLETSHSKVYVVQEAANRNLLPANSYGEIKVLLPPGQVAFSTGPTLRRLRDRLRHFRDTDYLLLMGDPAAIAMAAAVACDVNRGKFKMLKWDKQEQQYFAIAVDLYSKGE